MKPSVSVCMKLTSASSSASDRPSRPNSVVFKLSSDSGFGQQVVPSPVSLLLQRGNTSRVLRRSVDRTRNIWQPHLDGIGGRPLGLFSRRIAQSATGRTHVPEISPDQITLGRIVVKHRRQRRIGMRLRFAFTVARAHRAGVSPGRAIEFRNRSSESGFGHMAKSTSFIAQHRELLVIQHRLTDQFDLLDLIVRRRREPLERLRFNEVDLGLYTGDILRYFGSERRSDFLSTDRAGAEAHDDGGETEPRAGPSGYPA